MNQIFSQKLIILLFLAFLFPSSLQAKKNPDIVKGKDKSSLFSFFKKVDSCSPILVWKASEQAGVNYDVVLHRALDSGVGPPMPGQQVFYRENIAGTDVSVDVVLDSKTKYLWAVRVRKADGSVGPWSTYTKHNPLAPSGSGLWFGLKTPVCAVVRDLASITKPSERQYYYKKSLTPERAVQHLESGMGGIIIRAEARRMKSKTIAWKKYASEDEALMQETKPFKNRNPVKILMMPEDSQKEIHVKPYNGRYLFIATPGHYILTQLLQNTGYGTRAIRIYQKFTIKPKQLHYAGDTISLIPKRLFGGVIEPFVIHRPNRFKTWLTSTAPQLLPYLSQKQSSPQNSQHQPSSDTNESVWQKR